MPNWCENELMSSVPLDKYIDENGEFDFNLIKPMPKILNETQSPSPSKEDVEKIRLKGDIVEYNKVHVYEIAEKETGFRNWYDWSVVNWGCKWNCSNSSIVTDTHICFSTPWGPPIEVFEELCRQNPTAELTLKYGEPGMGFYGICQYDGDPIGGPYENEYNFDDEEGKEIAYYLFGQEFFQEDED